MVSAVVKTVFYRGLLPFSLFAAAIIRPCYLSLVYGFLGLLGPLLPPIRNNSSLSGATSSYLFITLLLSTIFGVGQIVFQITQHLAITSEDLYIDKCKNDDVLRILFNFGFVWVDQNHWPDAMRLVGPEIAVLLTSFITSCICIFGGTTVSTTSSTENIMELPGTSASSSESHPAPKKFPTHSFLPAIKKMSDVSITLFLAALGMVNPSLMNFIYFAIALLLVTWWALYTPLKRRTLNRIKLYLIVYTAFHFLVYLAYQTKATQDFSPPEAWPAKLSGLNSIVSPKCDKFWDIGWSETQEWTYYVNFFGLLVFYHVLIMQYRWTKNGIRGFISQEDAESSVHEEESNLVMEMTNMVPDRGNSSTESISLSEDGRCYIAIGIEPDEQQKRKRLTSSKKSVLLPNDTEANPDGNFPLQRITSEVVDRQKISFIFKGKGKVPSIWRRSMQQICYFILYHCYAFALLAMMTFALLYHSVFGLVFLLLPCMLWALPNSRQWSFRLSPVIVAYAEFLLIAQYIYSMPLEDLLPQDNYMKIIGFQLAANRTMAFVTLATKFLLLLPLFILLRLHLREHFYDSLSDHERLRQLNYGTFEVRRKDTVQEVTSEADRSFIRGDISAFENISKYLASIWIFVVALTLLYNCLTEPPVLYALGYFVLWSGLVCNLVISFAFFRKSIYLILTTLIVYSSIVIISLYIYQFPEVPKYWKEYTGLSDEWNRDIGLVDFKSDKVQASLFTRFFKPLSLLVVTMVQLKFFQSSWTRLVSTPEARSRSPSIDSFGRRGSCESDGKVFRKKAVVGCGDLDRTEGDGDLGDGYEQGWR
ncbi:unnamed protein product [Bursaphelenchus okinawaensis]|uniref:Piezo TM1-24 domain-containing protein n=1 Tax=Bursaphelenchus okinawaensis TaxID=465554 RepID=A0A811L0E7_9BILA|nr:unnamed protein product [Bursaphelenchus okinawaensis]CAG9115207.1 unnamed protein product [Bursaphelenchus okinawaensis]